MISLQFIYNLVYRSNARELYYPIVLDLINSMISKKHFFERTFFYKHSITFLFLTFIQSSNLFFKKYLIKFIIVLVKKGGIRISLPQRGLKRSRSL